MAPEQRKAPTANPTVNPAPIITSSPTISSSSSLTIRFGAGWTWFSIPFALDDMSVQNVFKDMTLSEGDLIKSQQQFTQYYEGYGWFGTLTHLNNVDGFKIRLQQPRNLVIRNWKHVNFPVTRMLSAGWTWIAHPFFQPRNITDAFESLPLKDGDYCKSNNAFTQYYEGFGWFGTLEEMNPYHAYKVNMHKAMTLTFESPTKSPSDNQPLR